METFHSKFLALALLSSIVGFTSEAADSTTDIRNSKRAMAMGETTVFAQGESKAGTNTAWRGGLGVNFPEGSSVRLLMAQRPAMERILPGEKVVTQAATTSSGGYNAAAATTDGTASSIAIVPTGCSISYTPPYYNVSATATLDASNIDIGSLPYDFAALYRYTQGGPVDNLLSVGWSTMFNESSSISCTAVGSSFPLNCYIQSRLRYKYMGGAESNISTVGKVCSYTNSTTYSWSDFTYTTN